MYQPQPTARAGDRADIWQPPIAAGPIRADIRLPGSKSMTNRALILAALAEDQTVITGPLAARDTQLMIAALRALGCVIEASEPGEPDHGGETWLVDPIRPGGRAVDIDVGNAGTVLRFTPPVAALTAADVTFTGDPQASRRPVGPLLAALRELGVRIDDAGTGAVPFVVHGAGSARGGGVTLDASSSSQLISGLLLAGARFDQGAEIRHQGAPVPSAPHIEMTVRMLRACGADVRTADGGERTDAGKSVTNAWTVLPGPIAPGRIDIEPDLSNALPFLAAALLTGGQVTLAGWPADSLQPAAQVAAVLTAMGGAVEDRADGLRVSGTGRISGITADLSEVGELTPVLTALAALASSPSKLTGIGHLRWHETDRLAALAGEVGKLGGDVTELDDGLAIRPRPLRADGVLFDSHEDHRMVMAAAVLGLAVPGLRVHNAATAGKTFPGFAGRWTRFCAAGRPGPSAPPGPSGPPR